MPLTSTQNSPVPFLDLVSQHADLQERILDDIRALFASCAFTNGAQVAEFERAFAAYCGTADAVGLASGLDALRLALVAAGCRPGDEVIVPANTFIATVEAVTQAGALPLLVDASERDWNVDVAAIEAAITPRTRFVMPVHLYGQMADMRALRALAERHDLLVIEDACQAHGADRGGLGAGAAGLAGAFSFYPGKNLGAIGDAGALVTDDLELAAKVRALREHGQREKYRHEVPGYTARLDTIQAVALLHKLPLLDAWTAQRRSAAAYYTDALAGVGDLRLPPVAPDSTPVWHLYVVRTERPERLAAFLRERGIASGRHYPEPIHLTAAYGDLGHRPGDFPVAEGLAREVLSLPMFPGIAEEQLQTVVDGVAEYFGAAAAAA
jgi:dTDP-4-amino-4,6-dideoxygalactose transaminase